MEMETRWLGRMEYAEALRLQEDLAARRRRGECPDTLLFLEHEPVYTIGRTPDRSSLGAGQLPHPLVEISRGGQATYHGPGQLIGYFIVDLREMGSDLHRYLRTLEEIVIGVAAAAGVRARRREGLTGVWVEERKLASIGVGVRHWVARHGLALNVTAESLSGYRHITPCGISGVQMTSLQAEGSPVADVESAAAMAGPVAVRALCGLRSPAGLPAVGGAGEGG